MNPRGVWELSTPVLEDLAATLARWGTVACSATRFQDAGFDGPPFAMLVGMPANYAYVLISAIVAERAARPRPELELVWSGPETARAMSRDTSQVLRELFDAAEQRVIIAGFAFWGASAIFDGLHRRAVAKRLDIEFFIHLDPTGRNVQMTPENFYRYTWPWSDVVPTIYYDARADGGAEQGTMHAKCVVVDEDTTFITSANFTSAAHDINVELGVLICDIEFATRAAAQWRTLAAAGLFRRLDVR